MDMPLKLRKKSIILSNLKSSNRKKRRRSD